MTTRCARSCRPACVARLKTSLTRCASSRRPKLRTSTATASWSTAAGAPNRKEDGRLQDPAQHVATVARKRPHLCGPTAELDGLRPGAAGKHLGALQLVVRAVARLALGNEGLLLSPDEHGERDAHRTSYREHARHLEK